MDAPVNNTFKLLMQKIVELPLWIKQIIYLELNEELKSSAAHSKLVSEKREDFLQIYTPQMTFLGEKELETRSRNFHSNTYKFLEGVSQKLNVVEIALNNGWSLAECAAFFIETLNAELLMPPKSSCIKGTALYISEKIRLGEYLVKLGKISIDQLDEALRTQKYIEKSVGDTTALGEILIKLGFVTKADTEGILFLKEESKKRYIPEISKVLSGATQGSSDLNKLEEQVAKLTRENNQLKEQLRKLFKIGG